MLKLAAFPIVNAMRTTYAITSHHIADSKELYTRRFP